MSKKNSNDTVGNRSRDLPACSTEPQPTTAYPCVCVCVCVCVFIYLNTPGCPSEGSGSSVNHDLTCLVECRQFHCYIQNSLQSECSLLVSLSAHTLFLRNALQYILPSTPTSTNRSLPLKVYQLKYCKLLLPRELVAHVPPVLFLHCIPLP